ncbi:MAG: lycopene cyclase domain-containing protein [bacterium]|nr:lycopene cyclase domain-containing protein [bacterium]
MVLEFKYAYLVLTIPFIVIWVLFFIFSKRTRFEQLVMSFLLAPVGPISEMLYFIDYWKPESILFTNIGPVKIFFEDLLFCFLVGGIGSVIYEAIFRKHLRRIKKINYKTSLVAILITVSVVSYLLFKIGVDSIFSTSIAAILGTVLIVSQRKDLLLDSIFSGVGVMCIMFLSYFLLSLLVLNVDELLRRGWLLYESGLDIRIIRNIPLTEMVWGFSWGMLIGPLYEFARKKKPT